MTPFVDSWRRAWSAIGAHGDGHRVMNDLLDRYSEPHRRYHTLQHLAECIATLETHTHLVLHPGELELALWFHDAIYDPHASDNEARSATLAEVAVMEGTGSKVAATRTRDLILATRHSNQPTDDDQRVLMDIDLWILGAPSDRFDEYERQVREEYGWVPQETYCTKRSAILQGFFDRPSIYGTTCFQAELESRARANLQRSIKRLVAHCP